MSEPDQPPTARDLVRKRSRSYRRDETGRHHHIGAAPDLQPLLGDDSMQYIGTSPVQLASRTAVQLQQQRALLVQQMGEAAQALEFERAAAVRDDLAAVDAELARRAG